MIEFFPSLARTAANAVGKGGQYDHEKILHQCKVAFQKNTVDRERARKANLEDAAQRRSIAEGFDTDNDEDHEELRAEYELEVSLNPSLMDATRVDNMDA